MQTETPTQSTHRWQTYPENDSMNQFPIHPYWSPLIRTHRTEVPAMYLEDSAASSPLTIRAVHIKVAQSLDTKSCLAEVTRFIARRGYLNTIISDNGMNFVGADKELKEFLDECELRLKVT